jgi:hypothetical protein
MKGAREFYKIFSNAAYKKCLIDGIKDVSSSFRKEYGGYANEIYKWGNVHFLLSEHARGRTFKIWLIDGKEQIEVYGVVDGNPGWTESYGWIKKGTWVKPVLKLIRDLEKEMARHDEEQAEIKRGIEREENKKIGATIDKFNKKFKVN